MPLARASPANCCFQASIAGGRAAALRGVGVGGQACEGGQGQEDGRGDCALIIRKKSLTCDRSRLSRRPRATVSQPLQSPGAASPARHRNRSARSARRPRGRRARNTRDRATAPPSGRPSADDAGEVELARHAVTERRAQAMSVETLDLRNLNHRRDPRFSRAAFQRAPAANYPPVRLRCASAHCLTSRAALAGR